MRQQHIWHFEGEAPDLAVVARELGKRVGSRFEIDPPSIYVLDCRAWIQDCQSSSHAFECFTFLEPYIQVQLGQVLRALGGTRTLHPLDEHPPAELDKPWAELSSWTKARLRCYLFWPKRWYPWRVSRPAAG